MSRYWQGEFWIQDGSVEFADGDVGEFNHEGIAYQEACRKLSDELGLEFDGEFDPFYEAIVEYAAELQEANGQEVSEMNTPQAIDVILRDNGKDPAQFRGLIACALMDPSADPREYAMKHWGWIWCKQRWFGVGKWDDQTKRNLISGANEILEQDGFYDGDEEEMGEDENPLDAELTIARADTGDRFYTTLRQLEAEGKTSGTPETPGGPNAQLRQQDIEDQPGYYGDRLGDSVMSPREFVERMLFG
jgi:hypothetical protein